MIRCRLYTSPAKKAHTLLAAAALAGLAFTAPAVRAAAEEVWNSPLTANWSSNAAWLDNSAPIAVGDPDLVLRFLSSGNLSRTAINDLGNLFKLNQLILENSGVGSLTIASAPSNSIQLTGANPIISSLGANFGIISSPLVLNPVGGNVVTISLSNTDGLNVGSSISEIGGARSLLIKGTSSSANTQAISLNGINSFTGGVILESANLSVTTSSALGTGALTVKGGTLRLISVTLANPIVLHTDLLIQSPGGSTISGVISSAVPGTGFIMRNSASALNLTAASTYTGATTIDYSLAASRAALSTIPGFIGGTGCLLRLSGNGSLLASSEFNIREAQLQIDGPAAGGASNRIGDNTAINLRSAQLSFTGVSSSLPQTETIGSLTGAGFSLVTADRSGVSFTTPVQLAANSLARVERGTFLFRGTNLGSSGTSRATILFTTAPAGLAGGGGAAGTSTISILPYAVGSSSALSTTTGVTTSANFVTYDSATGIRPLNLVTEYATALTAGAASNVRLGIPATNLANVTINALLLDGGTLDGSGQITLASGALLQNSGAFISNPIAFGTAEANIFVFSDLLLSGVLSGTNGLTKSGVGKLTLGASNSLSGTLTINAGLIGFNSLSNLGTATSALVINGTEAGLSYAGTNALTLSRNLETRTGIARFEAIGSGDLTISGVITGAGGIRITANAGRAVELTGANGFTGPIVLSSGSLRIGSDAALGNGGGIDFSGGSLVLNGAWTTSREISLTAASSIDTGANTAIINGLLTGSRAWTKNGTGALRIMAVQPYSGPLTVNAGSVELAGNGALQLVEDYFIKKAGNLVLDNTAIAKTSRVSPTAALTLSAGKITLLGNGTAPVSETIGALILENGSGGNVITINAPGAAATTLRIASLATNGGDLLLRSNNLGSLSRVLAPAGFSPAGIVPRFYADNDLNGTGKSFVVYDSTSDASGTIGFRALTAAEIVSGSLIKNPSNGGSVPVEAHFLTTGAAAAAGTFNSIGSLTLDAGSGLALGTGQTLAISSGNLLARAGATSITGGTLDLGANGGIFYAGADFEIASTVTGSGGLTKTGPGTLTFKSYNSLPAYTGGTTITNGRLRIGPGISFGAQTITAAQHGILEINNVSNSSTAISAIAGTGEIAINSGELQVGVTRDDLTFGGNISGAGSLVLGTNLNYNSIVTLSGVNTLSGNIVLLSNRLIINSGDALGTATLEAAGGTLQPGAALTLKTPLLLDTYLPIIGPNTVTFGPGSSIRSPNSAPSMYGIVVRGTGDVIVQTPLTSAICSAPGGAFEFVTVPGAILLYGAIGSISTPFGIRIDTGSLFINDTIAFAGPVGGRIDDSTPVELRGGRLGFTGNASALSAETIGALSSAGYSEVSFSSKIPGIQLTAASLNRIDHGTFSFESSNFLGLPLGGSFGTNLLFSTAPAGLIGGGGTGADTSILPYANSNGSLVTYDLATGIRPLASSEYASNLSAGASKNVSLYAGTPLANNAAVTINALRLVYNTSIAGSGSITIGSGVISLNMPSGTLSSIDNSLIFDSTEANLFLSGGDLQLNGVVPGSGGITISGSGSVRLNAANTFTGQITINRASLYYDSSANLGSGSLPIVLHGGAIRSVNSANLTLNRDVKINSGIGILATPNSPSSATFTVPSVISGPGSLEILGYGFVILSGTNTYEGATRISGRLAIASDASLGALPSQYSGNTLIQFNSSIATLKLNGPWISRRNLEFASAGTLDTNGFDAALSSQLTRTGMLYETSLTKAGSGTLTLSSRSPFDAKITINDGTFSLNQNGSLRSTSVLAVNDSVLLLDNSTIQNTDRLPDNAAITLSNGSLRLLGNSDAGSTESLGVLSNAPKTHLTVTLTAPGTSGTRLNFASLSSSSSQMLFRGDNLGGAPGSASTRIVFSTPPSLSGNIIAGAVADSASNGTGFSLAAYDSSTDAAGTIGVRPLRPDEFFSNGVIQNPINGGSTPADANFQARSATTLAGAANNLNTLTFAQGGGLTLAESQSLTLSKAGIYIPGTVDAAITGGKIFGIANLLGDGNLTINSKLGNVPALLKMGSGILTLNGQLQSYGVDLTIAGGTIRTGAGNPLVNARLTLGTGTTFDLNGNSTRIAALSGVGSVLLGASTLTAGAGDFSGSISGSGGLIRSNPNGLALRGSNPFTGPVQVIGDGVVSSFLVSPTQMALIDGGAFLGTSSLSVSGNAYVQFDNTNSKLSRIGVVPVLLNQGKFELIGNLADSLTQNIGPLTARGSSTLIVNAANGRKFTNLNFTFLNRADHGTLEFRSALDSSISSGIALGSSLAKISFNSTLASSLAGANTSITNRGILPFAIGTTPTASAQVAGFVTYDAVNGIRPLDTATEYSSSLSTGDNVRLVTPVINNATVAINSLVPQASITGTGTLSINSGAIFTPDTSSSLQIGNSLRFDNAEAVIWSTGNLTLAGSLNGSGGLTKSGMGMLFLNGANNITGPLTINQGTLQVPDLAHLGTETSAIVLNDAALKIDSPEGITVALSRPILVNGVRGSIGAGSGTLQIDTPISGGGGINIAGNVVFNAVNTYTGNTGISQNSKLTIGSDAILGASPTLLLSGTLALSGPWITERSVQTIGSGAAIDTAGMNAELRGSLSGVELLQKLGTGRLTINEAGNFFGSLNVTAGTLDVNGSMQPQSVYAGKTGTLTGKGPILSTVSIEGTLAPGNGIGTLNTGSLLFYNSPTLAIELGSANNFDQVQVTGTLSLLGLVNLTLELAPGFNPAAEVDVFPILLNDGVDPVSLNGTGRFTIGGVILDEGTLFRIGQNTFSFSYTGGTGNDVVIYAVPEPASALLMLSGALSLGFLRRRSKTCQP